MKYFVYQIIFISIIYSYILYQLTDKILINSFIILNDIINISNNNNLIFNLNKLYITFQQF